VKPEEALDFLERHQPMPPDEQLTEALIGEYDEAWRALKDSDDPRVADLLLNSFGEGDGWGVYQLVDEALRSLPRQSVVEALDRSLASPFRSVRAWSMDMALDFPDTRLIPRALTLLSSDDRDQRVFAAYYLSGFETHEEGTVEVLRDALHRESDDEIRSVLQESIVTHQRSA